MISATVVIKTILFLVGFYILIDLVRGDSQHNSKDDNFKY